MVENASTVGVLTNASDSNSSNVQCYDLEKNEDWMVNVQASVLAFMFLTSLVENSLIVLMVSKYKQLQCISVIASLNIVVADLLWSFSHHLPSVINLYARHWVFTSYGCVILGYLKVELQVTRWLILGIVAFDRFCTVRFPFRYEKRKKIVLSILLLTAWILPVFLCIPLVIPNFKIDLPVITGDQTYCYLDCLQEEKQPCRIYFTLLFSISLLIGGILPTVIYIWLYRQARKLRTTATEVGKMVVQVATGVVVHQPIIQNKLLDRAAREGRSIITFAIIFITVLVTGLVYLTFELVRTVNIETWCGLPMAAKFIIVDIWSSTITLDPVLIMRDGDFHWCLKDLFSCCRLPLYEAESTEVSMQYPRDSRSSIGSLSNMGRIINCGNESESPIQQTHSGVSSETASSSCQVDETLSSQCGELEYV